MKRRNPSSDDRSCADVIEFILDDVTRRFGKDWGGRHVKAFNTPNAKETGIVSLIWALAIYADGYREQFGDSIGNDGFAAEVWAGLIGGTLQLLNMEIGRLDGGTLDRTLREMAQSQDVDPEDL